VSEAVHALSDAGDEPQSAARTKVVSTPMMNGSPVPQVPLPDRGRRASPSLRVRLSRSAMLIPCDTGVVLHSALATLGLEGPDARALVNAVVPLLDGTLMRPEVIDKFPVALRVHVESLLDLFNRQGLLEESSDSDAVSVSARWDAQRRFITAFKDPVEESTASLADCRVLFAGLEPWGATAAWDLAAAGVGTLHIVDDGEVTQTDLLSAPFWGNDAVARPRRQALVKVLSEQAPWSRLSATRADFAAGWPDGLDRNWDLVVVSMCPDQLPQQLAVARVAHKLGLKTLTGSLAGIEARVGPLVVPGKTACWNCCRLRLLANAAQPWAEHAVQGALSNGETSRNRRTGAMGPPRPMLGPMAPLLGHLVALEVLKLLTRHSPSQLVGRLAVQNLVTLETSSHAVIPTPYCEVCGGAGEVSGLPWEPRPRGWTDAATEDELRRSLDGWVDERTGIVSHVVLRDRDVGDPQFPVCARALPAAGVRDAAAPVAVESCGGKGMTAVQAMIGAVGEAVERYSASNPASHALFSAALRELDGDVLDPQRLCLYDDEVYDRPGFPYVRFDPDRPQLWTRGRWVDTDEPVWVPALSAFYQSSMRIGDCYCQVTSNGLASGRDLEDASLRAIFETVERDAFLISWLGRLPGTRLALDESLDDESRQVIDQLEDAGARVELYLLDVGLGIPTAVCLALGDGCRWPGATVASAAHLDPRLATRNAILEQGFSGPFVRQVMARRERAIPESPDQVRSFLDHALFYVPVVRSVAFNFLRSGTEAPISLRKIPRPNEISLKVCAERLAAGGVRIAVVDVTSPDVRLGPFRVVRALGNDLQALHCGYGMERLANPRLKRWLVEGANVNIHPLC
jgi:ribosomal protein S12 methylthiotransferase accessory factor